MNCMCKKCDQKAVKKCRHGFYTCDKHYHGCNNEQKIRG
jgi:hypothetical protein